MMNNARLSVGLSGLAIAEVAYQQALAYAQERRQGRAPGAPAGELSPIIDHADVRRMLLTIRATVEAMRGLIYLNAQAIDRQRRGRDEAERQGGRELADLLTPVSKAWCTDMGLEMARIATQVHGGMGYIEETGIAQRERDIRIAPIYEGTNGIQAIDLVGRKLGLRGGGVVDEFLGRIEDLDAELADAGPGLEPIGSRLADAVGALREATGWILANGAGDPDQALAAATPYLRMFGTTVGGWVMARQALAAHRLGAGPDGPTRDDGEAGADGADRAFLAAKVVSARFYCDQLLPPVRGLLPAVRAGKDDLFAIPTAGLAST